MRRNAYRLKIRDPVKPVNIRILKKIDVKMKLGIVILRKDTAQPGIASISRKTGKAVPAATT